MRCNPRDFAVEDVASRLGIQVFATDMKLTEKFALPSSVGSYQRRTYFCIRLRLKDDFDIESEALMEFLQEAASKL